MNLIHYFLFYKELIIISKNIKKSQGGPKSDFFLNHSIRFPKIFVIDENKEKLGVMAKNDAIKMAEERGLDLLLISVNKDPVTNEPRPIACFIDYGKFKYEHKKKNKELKTKQTTIDNREIRLTVNIGEHDLKTKAKKAREFLLKGDHLKVSLKFKGREKFKPELGQETIDRFIKEVDDIAMIAKPASINASKFLDIYLQQDKKKVQKYLAENKGEDNAKDENQISS